MLLASAYSHDLACMNHEGFEKESATCDDRRESWSHSYASHQVCESQRASSSWNHGAYASQTESEDASTDHAE